MKKKFLVLAVLAVLAVASTPAPAHAICGSETCFAFRTALCDQRWSSCNEGNPNAGACNNLMICYAMAADLCGCLVYMTNPVQTIKRPMTTPFRAPGHSKQKQ